MINSLRWIAVAAAVIAVFGYLVTRLADERALRLAAEQRAEQMSSTLEQERARYEQTDRMLAKAVQQRTEATQEAARLAADLAQVQGCLAVRIPDDIADRVREYRGQVSERAGTAGVD